MPIFQIFGQPFENFFFRKILKKSSRSFQNRAENQINTSERPQTYFQAKKSEKSEGKNFTKKTSVKNFPNFHVVYLMKMSKNLKNIFLRNQA